jgi:hypothetical protein
MHTTVRRCTFLLSALSLFPCVWQSKETAGYKILPPITEANLSVFPVLSASSGGNMDDTSRFLTLDEGIRSGTVIVTEATQSSGLVRPRTPVVNEGAIWTERRSQLPRAAARVNSLALFNNSDRPLLLLAGEIVTGGKQDRIVAKDRIVPAHGDPVSLDVFCVEPHRWTETSTKFAGSDSYMAQPAVRSKALAERSQERVWDEVARSRATFSSRVAAPDARSIEQSSSYAGAARNAGVAHQLDVIAVPVERSYRKLMQQLRAGNAVGAVVSVNGELIWADVFASPALLEKYLPKLIRSYAAESLGPRVSPAMLHPTPSAEAALAFLKQMIGTHENIETEPRVYRNTHTTGEDFEAFVLTSLLPNTGFDVHIAKMKR